LVDSYFAAAQVGCPLADALRACKQAACKKSFYFKLFVSIARMPNPFFAL
jgi:hypothetical protein